MKYYTHECTDILSEAEFKEFESRLKYGWFRPLKIVFNL